MEFSKTWDLDKYKSKFESDEHWQLRKKFMEAHKNQYPEEKLVCLARVFCNIEFLGCRYPEKTMKLVAELSKGVADNYREKQKGKLKRTFVQASDAAGAKIKGRGATPPSKITEGPPSKTTRTSNSNPSTAGFTYSCFVHEGLVKPPVQEVARNLLFPGFIIYESCKTNCPISILSQSSQKSKTWNVISFDFPAEKNLTPNERCCEISLNKKFLSSGVGPTNKEAKIIAATEGLNKLRQTCYTIQEKLSFFTDKELVSKEQVVRGKDGPAPLSQDNIGSKMMMKMGWTGAGLGKNQQGIKAPIEASQTMRRAGLGHLSDTQFQAKFINVFKDYIASGSTNDLVFAPDFSAEERKTLHRSDKLVEKINQAIEEGIKKVDEDDGEDLFGFDSESEVIFPNSSDEEVEEDSEDKEADTQTCEVCCKLDSLTGEESDDDLYDKMWGTCSDTSGLVNIAEDSHMSLRESKSIEDQADNIEVNAKYIESTQSLSHKNKTVKTDLPMSHISQSNLSASLSYCSDGVIPMLPNATNNEDPVLHSRVSSVVSNLNRVLEQRAMGLPTSLSPPRPFLNTPPSPTFLKTPSVHPALNHQTFPHKVILDRAKFRVFLPDGSWKRLPGKVFKANNELLAFISNQHPARITATYQDFRTIKALRDLFPEFASKLDSEEKLQSERDYQDICDRPLAELDSEKTSDLNTEIKKVSAHQSCDTDVTINDGMIYNTENQNLKNSLPNIQGNFSEVKDDEKSLDTRRELAQSDEMRLVSSSDMEIESDLSDNQSSVHSEAINQTQPKRKRGGAPRVLLTLADGSTVRVNTNYLKYNNNFIRHDRRKRWIAKGLFKPDEIPPPEYSDSSSDESETEWVPKTNLWISEPEGCEIDNVHVVRRRWEQFIVKFGSSKRNPYAKRWQNFVDQSSLDETKYLCQKWKEFLVTWNELEARRLPASILKPGHQLVALSHTKQAYIPPCDSSCIDPNLITVYLTGFGKTKISKDLILNKSWTGRKNDKLPLSTDKTPGLKENFTKLFCQLSESETTTTPEQLVQNSVKATSKLSEDRYSNYCKTDVSKSVVTKTSVDSVSEDKVVFERDGENYPPIHDLHQPPFPPNATNDMEVESELSDNQSTVAQGSGNLTCKPTGDRFLFLCKPDIAMSEVTKTMSIGSVDDEHDGFSESDEETSVKEDSSSCKRDLPNYTLPVRKRAKRPPKIRLTLHDGCRIRIKASDLRWNKHFMCHRKRLLSIKKGLINRDEIPPPDYSDSSTDEEESDWVTKSGILITEPENCEIDKNHILRRRWEQYILTLGSSKRNPFAKKWREFVDKSPVGENKTLCQKWRDFMMMIHPLYGATDMPDSVFEEGHKPITSFSQAGSNTSILFCDSSEPKVTDGLHKHLLESVVCSTQSDLEKHINSSDLTVVYSSIDSPVSPPKKRTKPKKNKNPNLVTAYFGDGSKVKVDHILLPNKRTQGNWLNKFQV